MYVIELVGPGEQWDENVPVAKGVIGLCDAGYTVLLNSDTNYMGEPPTDEERAAFRLITERLGSTS